MVALWLQSLEPFYDGFDPDFVNIRKTVREVLQKEDDLNEIVQLVGKVTFVQLNNQLTNQSSNQIRLCSWSAR